jgi:hypothetical protein
MEVQMHPMVRAIPRFIQLYSHYHRVHLNLHNMGYPTL